MRRTRNETKPRKRNKEWDGHINSITKILCEKIGFEIPSDVDIYAVEQCRGFWRPSKNYITIPMWAIRKSLGEGGYKYTEGYDIYYIAHELAHMVLTKRGVRGVKPHGKEFMECFKSLCPEEFWHYELDYKPRNAKNAGIMRKDV